MQKGCNAGRVRIGVSNTNYLSNQVMFVTPNLFRPNSYTTH